MNITAESILEDIEILLAQNEDDFDRGKGKFLLRKYIKERREQLKPKLPDHAMDIDNPEHPWNIRK